MRLTGWTRDSDWGAFSYYANGVKAISWKAQYYPFGGLASEQVSVMNNLRFPGQYHDRATDLYYNMYRTYQPELGRYLTPDPIGLAGGLNLYGYAGQNPIDYTDPRGLSIDEWLSLRPTGPSTECPGGDCDHSWALCYTNCINLLAPFREEFVLGTQIAVNAPYTVVPIVVSPDEVVFRSVRHFWTEVFPRAGSVATKVSGIVRPVQVVGFAWIAGASYGCMISCALNKCSY